MDYHTGQTPKIAIQTPSKQIFTVMNVVGAEVMSALKTAAVLWVRFLRLIGKQGRLVSLLYFVAISDDVYAGVDVSFRMCVCVHGGI